MKGTGEYTADWPDIARQRKEEADRLRDLKIEQIFLACDNEDSIKPLRKALNILQIPRHKARCYVLLKYDSNETILEALARLIQVWEAGAKPSAQLYQPPDKYIDYPIEWKRLQRKWERPAATWRHIEQIIKEATK